MSGSSFTMESVASKKMKCLFCILTLCKQIFPCGVVANGSRLSTFPCLQRIKGESIDDQMSPAN